MSMAEKYVREGHPTIDELILGQQLAFPRDPWRGHGNTDPAA
jgi:hypothetical protein